MDSFAKKSVLYGPVTTFSMSYMHLLFENKAEDVGSRNALLFKTDESLRKTTYSSLQVKSNSFARAIVALSKAKNPNSDGDYLVAICLPPSDDLILCILAIWKAGAAYLPVDTDIPFGRASHILSEANPVLLIYQDNATISELQDVQTISYGELKNLARTYPNENLLVEDTIALAWSEVAAVLYTSGSTGISKGVRLHQKMLLNRLRWEWDTFPYSKTERCFAFKTTYTFIDSIFEVWGPLLKGLTVVVVPKSVTKNPEQLVALLENYKIGRLFLVPTLLRTILFFLNRHINRMLLQNLKLWVSTGEVLPISLANEFFDYFEEGTHRLCNFYGATEVSDISFFVCDSRNQLTNYVDMPIGTSTSNTAIYILDENMKPVPIGVTGEVYVSGMNLCLGYINQRDQNRFISNAFSTDSCFNRLYRMGDFAMMDKDNLVFYGARSDSQMKIRGHRIDLSEIETSLIGLPTISKVVVLCYHAGKDDQALVAFVTLTSPRYTDFKAQIEGELKYSLPSFMIPQIFIVESIPLLPNGKVDRQGLLLMYEDDQRINNDDLDFDFTGVERAHMPAANDLFEAVLGCIKGGLKSSELNINKNFFDLGGDSLSSIELVEQLQKRGYIISIVNFVSANSLKDILNHIVAPKQTNDIGWRRMSMALQLKAFPIDLETKEEAITISNQSFYEKGDLELLLDPSIGKNDYAVLLNELWHYFIDRNVSFYVKNIDGQIVGVCINYDPRDVPFMSVSNELQPIFDFLDSIEEPIKKTRLPQGKGKVLYSFMMSTNAGISPNEKLAIMHFMEMEVILVAKRHMFKGVFTTNTSSVTQYLDSCIFGYKTMTTFQVNQYVHHNGTRPFASAPDSQKVVSYWKELDS